MWAKSTVDGHIRQMAHNFIDCPNVEVVFSSPTTDFRYRCLTCGNVSETSTVVIYNFVSEYGSFWNTHMCEQCDRDIQAKVDKWTHRLSGEQRQIINYKRMMKKVIRRFKLGRA